MCSMTLAPSLIDPILTANVYCSRYLDDLLREAVIPFWSALRAEPAHDGFIWFYRYGKRGEHLKLRVHAPESRRAALQDSLGKAMSDFLESVSNAPPVERISKSALPPLDVEDAVAEDYPDRSLLWTTYRRSPAIIGDPAYARDDRHVAYFTQALAASSDFILGEVVGGSKDPAYLRRRQNSFLKLVIAGLAVTDLSPAAWTVYFTYHRDWLVRHLATLAPSAVDAATVMAEIEGQLDKARAALPALARIMAAQRATASEQGDGLLGAWIVAVRNFFEHVKSYRGRPEYNCDPYTDDHAFLPLFKLFHASANQFGFRISNEAYLHHLLLQAAQVPLENEPAPAGQG